MNVTSETAWVTIIQWAIQEFQCKWDCLLYFQYLSIAQEELEMLKASRGAEEERFSLANAQIVDLQQQNKNLKVDFTYFLHNFWFVDFIEQTKWTDKWTQIWFGTCKGKDKRFSKSGQWWKG
jgi:hypothetical protein